MSLPGHQFRGDYLKLGQLRQCCTGVIFVALTATAPKIVADDCLQRLQMKKAIQFKKPVFRENLFYEVVVRDDDHHTITDHSYQDVQDYCEKIFRESGPGQVC